jgi:Holliday junction resolvasome RuvABC DNA-binding subunit|tara:strand:- start:178 stop:375 length:198 start_codon:yes stop_codon:yes gene_type:complete
MNEIYLAQAVFRLIKDRREVILNALEYNSVKNMEHYKELMGGLEALGYIETEIKNLLEKQEQEEV